MKLLNSRPFSMRRSAIHRETVRTFEAAALVTERHGCPLNRHGIIRGGLWRRANR